MVKTMQEREEMFKRLNDTLKSKPPLTKDEASKIIDRVFESLKPMQTRMENSSHPSEPDKHFDCLM